MKAQEDLESRTIFIPKGIAPLLDFMLKKAEIDLSDINDSFIKVWINQNLDLLSLEDKVRFGIDN
jgi:hypothetical protein